MIEQWVELIEKVAPMASYEIVKSKPIQNPDADIYIMNIINIPKHPLGSFKEIGTLICDEIHLLMSAKSHKSFYCIQPRYIIALSATPYRNDVYHDLIGMFFGPVVIEKHLQKEYQVYIVDTLKYYQVT